MKKKDRSLVFRFYRPLAIGICKLLLKTPLTGNQISLFTIFFTLFCFALIAVGHILSGVLLLQVVLLLDCMDGAMARMKKQESSRGLYLEAVWHECVFPLFYLALGMYSYRAFNNPNYIIMGSLIAILIPIINLLFHRHSMIFKIEEKPAKKNTKLQYIVRWLTCPSYLFTYALILTFFDWTHLMLIFYSIFYLLLVLYKFKVFVLSSENQDY